MRFVLFTALLVCVVAPQTVSSAEPVKPLPADHIERGRKGTELFKTSVRAILKSNCLRCHGGKKVESEFDLSTREKLLKGGHAGTAVVPYDAKSSLLYQMTAHLKEPTMPEGADKLPDAQIQALEQWIDYGAPYDIPLVEIADAKAWTTTVVPPEAKKHWSFQPLTKSTIPTGLNPVDYFIRDAWKKAGIQGNALADKRTLARRLAFSLTGLPPTDAVLTSFLNDNSATATATLIDTLLASPQYGERWARHWLDLVRYAESHGFEHDYDRPTAFHYRDFVIKAFNSDLPFTTFTRWQIAGDEYAPENPLAMTATGYLAAGVHSTQITISEAAKHRYDELDDIVANLGTTFLGLTIGCARCHDHKYDPIPARDYYQLLSTFTKTVRSEQEVQFDRDTYNTAKAEFDRLHQPFMTALKDYERDTLPKTFTTWEISEAKTTASAWSVPKVLAAKSAGGATVTPQPDGSVIVSGKNPEHETITLTLSTGTAPIRHLRLEAMLDASMKKNGPGRAENQNFALTDIVIAAEAKSQPKTNSKLKNARATFEQTGLLAAYTIDADATSGWAVDPQFGRAHAIAFELVEPYQPGPDAKLTVTLKFNNNSGHGIGRPRISIASQSIPPELLADTTPQPIAVALATVPDKRTAEQKTELLKWYAPRDAAWQKLATAEHDHAAKAPKPDLRKALISTEGAQALRLHTQGTDTLTATHFLKRGDVGQQDGVANSSFLQVLMPSADAASQWKKPAPPASKTSFERTALAEWLTDTDSGAGRLLARVIVNRVWQKHFGRGIVPTTSDFGLRGDPPSHPELLDYLASELIRQNWQLKSLHRLILSSATYQQSSDANPKAKAVDLENKLLARFPVRRLEAESIRDTLLSVSGRLNSSMYGPGTLDETMTRRSIYFGVKRSKLIPSLVVFDIPDGTVGVGERPHTTIAPQALHLMNNTEVRASAKALATLVRAVKFSAGKITPNIVVTEAYQRTLQRAPTPAELSQGISFLLEQTTRYGTAADAELLATIDYCQILFCLNEFVYVE